MPTILLVEDEKLLAEMYQDKLKEIGFGVDLAFSAEEALDYLGEKRPDLILLDILLPREDGIFLLKKLKEDKNISEIPVVAFSNYDDPKAKKEALELGAKAYLIKTQYTPKELIEEVKKFLPKPHP